MMDTEIINSDYTFGVKKCHEESSYNGLSEESASQNHGFKNHVDSLEINRLRLKNTVEKFNECQFST